MKFNRQSNANARLYETRNRDHQCFDSREFFAIELMSVRFLRLLAAAGLWMASTAFAAELATAPLRHVSGTPLPNIIGGDFDHFAVDLSRSRLYVSAEAYGSIEAFSLPDGMHIASIRTVAKAPHKILLANGDKELLIADAGDAALKVVDMTRFKVAKTIALAP